MSKILIATCDIEVRLQLRDFLKKNGFLVTCIETKDDALIKMSKDFFDLIISDIATPIANEYELVRSLRESGYNTPVLMISAKSEYEDMRLGFLFGADDYMLKPVNLDEMLLRINALLRRAQMINDKSQTIGNTTLELKTLSVFTSEGRIVLPPKEFMLLYKMFSCQGKLFTRQCLMGDIWGYNTDSDVHTLEVHIGNLRNKFRDNPDFEIVTTRGVGYKVVKK